MNSSEEIVEQSLSELEQNALARRQRIRALRAKFANENGQQQGNEDEEGQRADREETISLLFRSYKPATKDAPQATIPHIGKSKKEIDALEQNIADQLEASEDTKVQDTLDLNTLAPRKVDWDLRRGIQDKLDKLDRRTRKAITQIIRTRLNDDGNDRQMDTAALSPGISRNAGEEQ